MNILGKKGNKILTIFLLLTGSFFGQTQQQAKNFINISMKGVYKTQKDLMTGKVAASVDPDLRKAMKYQFIAVKLYNQNNFKEAVVYAYKTRVIIVEVLTTTDAVVKDKMKVSDEERTYFDPEKVGELKLSPKILNAADSKMIDDTNINDYEAFRKIPLGIPIDND
jgi:hypothetical protein